MFLAIIGVITKETNSLGLAKRIAHNDIKIIVSALEFSTAYVTDRVRSA